MATPILMPSLSPTMTEGKITKWLKKEGDKIASSTAVAEVETDKSNLEVEAYEDGYLLAIVTKENQSAKVGAPIAFIGEKGEKVDVSQATAAAAPAPTPAAAKPAAPPPKPPPAPVAKAPAAPAPKPAAQVVQLRPQAAAPSAGEGGGGRVRASPLARKMAEQQGLDLHALAGSGPSGRIVKRDIEAAMSQGGAARKVSAPAFQPAMGRVEPDVIALSGMRKVIAQRMSEVKPGVPHFYLTVEVDMDQAMKIRDEAKALDSKVSVNDIIVKAAAIALRRSPAVNVSYQGDHLLQFHNADVGIAVAIDGGLITPVIKDADQKGLAQISAEAKDLAERARLKKLKPEEYSGGSITVSNLGMYGIDQFVAVINPPQAGILAVGAVAEKPVVRNGQLAVGKVMTVTFSGDHRAIDGALGAIYLKELKGLLEHPMRLLF
ncbi:MAG: pyruvate dehydrogenase complex dihydrolipoamide acetyltransferase [Myxococcaceae bacterium]